MHAQFTRATRYTSYKDMATDNHQGSVPQTTATAPANKSQFIRTMAKDMATLGNTPAPVQDVHAVILPKEEESFWSKPMPKEVPQEVVALPTLEEAAAITTPTSTPPPPILAPVQTDENREAILARLRQKVSESAQMAVQEYPAPAVPLQPQKEAENAWPDIPTPAPSFAPTPETAPVERIPPVAREAAPDAPEKLHTYKSDFADRIDKKEATTFSVLAAQQEAGATPVPQALTKDTGSNKRMLAAIASGVVLLVLAAGGVYATYRFVLTMRDIPVASVTVPSIIFADEYKEITGTGPALMEALAASANETLVSGNVLVTYVTEPLAGEKGTLLTKAAQGGVLVRALELEAPDILLRNIAPESTVGIVHAGSETRAFFALRVDSFERTYAGMLTWEPVMQRQLAILYPPYPADTAPAPAVATTTAATTTLQSEPIQASVLTRFTDTIVANHDVRVLRDTAGKSVLLYGYVDKQTLIIARDELAFETLAARLNSGE